MSTRRSSTGSTRGPDTPAAKKAPAKRARASRTPDKPADQQLQPERQEAKPDVMQQELSIAPALRAREPSPPPVVPRPQLASAAPPRIEISHDARRAMVAEAAYLRAERRGFGHGGEVEDWLAAEAEVDKLLQGGHGTRAQ